MSNNDNNYNKYIGQNEKKSVRNLKIIFITKSIYKFYI